MPTRLDLRMVGVSHDTHDTLKELKRGIKARSIEDVIITLAREQKLQQGEQQ